MKIELTKCAGALLLAAATLGLTSCASTTGNEVVDLIETEDGAIIVDAITITAKVIDVEPATRKVTLVSPTGLKTTYKCGPEVVNFSQIKTGDQVKATVTEAAAITIGTGAATSATVGAGVALAPVGAKPGGTFVDTAQVTAKVIAMNMGNNRVTLLFPDGSVRQVKVGSQVDLATVSLGTDVSVQLSEGLALSVEKP